MHWISNSLLHRRATIPEPLDLVPRAFRSLDIQFACAELPVRSATDLRMQAFQNLKDLAKAGGSEPAKTEAFLGYVRYDYRRFAIPNCDPEKQYRVLPEVKVD